MQSQFTATIFFFFWKKEEEKKNKTRGTKSNTQQCIKKQKMCDCFHMQAFFHCFANIYTVYMREYVCM